MPITFQNINGSGGITLQNNTNSGNISFPTPPPPPTPLYSDFGQYIVGGVRQATTYIDLNTISIYLDVVSPVTVSTFKIIRIPPTNWSTLLDNFTGYFYVPRRGVGSINGVSGGLVDVRTKSVVYTPPVVGERANTTSQYDIIEVEIYEYLTGLTITGSLTVGRYYLAVNSPTDTATALLTNSTFPIDTTKSIYPSTALSPFTTTHVAIEIY